MIHDAADLCFIKYFCFFWEGLIVLLNSKRDISYNIRCNGKAKPDRDIVLNIRIGCMPIMWNKQLTRGRALLYQDIQQAIVALESNQASEPPSAYWASGIVNLTDARRTKGMLTRELDRYS